MRPRRPAARAGRCHKRETTTFYYDDRGNVTTKIDPLGARTTYAYYPDSDRAKLETDHYANVKSMAYDVAGNLTAETLGADPDQDPAHPTTGYTTRTVYNALSAPTRLTDADGRVQTFDYDPVTNELLTHTVGADPANPAAGDKTTYTYYADGTLKTTTDALGNVTSYQYNYAFTDAAHPGAVKQVTTTVIDPAGPAGSDRTNAADAVLRQTQTLHDRQENQVAQIVSRNLPDGTAEDVVTRYIYDSENRLRATVLPDGRVTETRYNAIGKEAQSLQWQSKADDATTERAFFDAEDRKVWSQDRRGYRTFFTYDDVGRQRFVIHPDANDGVGEAAPSEPTDARLADNPKSETQYDLIGRVTAQIDEAGAKTSFTYEDGCGCAQRRKEMIQHRPEGNLVTTYTYDKAGNLTYVTDPRGATTRTDYDDRGRPTIVTHPATDEHPATQSETRYDALGRRIAVIDQEGKITRYRFDGLGRLVEVRQYLDAATAESDSDSQLSTLNSQLISTRYTYDELGNQVTQTDALGRTTTYWTDVAGRRTKRILPKEATESAALEEALQYDGWGNLWKRTDFGGKTTTFLYDALNRLTSKSADTTHPSLGYSHAITRVEYDYDENGARKAARTYNGSNVLLYSETTPRDERGRLDYKDTAGGRLDYGYHANNLLKDVVSSNPGGVNVGYRYDKVNRLAHVDDASTGTTLTSDYTYNANGSLETLTQPNGVVHTYGYDALNRLRTLTVAKGATTLHAYEYKLRVSGHRRQVLEGARTTSYTYDKLYRLTNEAIAGDTHGNNGEIGYELDKVGNRKARSSHLSAISGQLNLTYNARDWLNGDTYDANGNTVVGSLSSLVSGPSSLSGTDAYDFENRLIARTRADGSTVNISYDADGIRIAKSILDGTGAAVSATSWLVDANNLTGYAQVLEERIATTSGTALRTYTYGTSLISQSLVSGPSSLVSYFAADGHGNVRELTDGSGAVTDRYDYDAFGTLIHRAGVTDNAYLYCGEQYDPDLGLYYLRARYMNADSGRFWSMDSHGGAADDPVSLHKYLYAQHDPVKFVDPSGYISIVETQAVLYNLGIRMVPVATKISFFVAEAAGVSTIGVGAIRGAVALGTAADRALPPGLSVGQLFTAALKLPKGIVVGAHRFVRRAISGSGMQSNHLNQTAAFPLAGADDALTISLKGSTATKGSQHYHFHRVLEEFWSKFRNGPLSFRPPTNAEYDDALREALAEAEVPAGAIEELVALARASRRAVGYFDDAGGLPPTVPQAIPGVP